MAKEPLGPFGLIGKERNRNMYVSDRQRLKNQIESTNPEKPPSLFLQDYVVVAVEAHLGILIDFGVFHSGRCHFVGVCRAYVQPPYVTSMRLF